MNTYFCATNCMENCLENIHPAIFVRPCMALCGVVWIKCVIGFRVEFSFFLSFSSLTGEKIASTAWVLKRYFRIIPFFFFFLMKSFWKQFVVHRAKISHANLHTKLFCNFAQIKKKTRFKRFKVLWFTPHSIMNHKPVFYHFLSATRSSFQNE